VSARTRSVARAAVAVVAELAIRSPVLVTPPAAATPRFEGLRVLTIVTVPPIAGVTVVLNGAALTTGRGGIVRTVITKQQRTELVADRNAHLAMSTRQIALSDGVRARFNGWYDGGYHFSSTDRSGQIEVAAFDVDYRTSFAFVDSHRAPVDPRRVTAMELKDTLGATVDARGATPLWLRGRSVVAAGGQVTLRDIEYRLTTVTVRGANVVTRGKQRFVPTDNSPVRIALRLFTVKFRARDAFFGWPRGSAIDIHMGDGTTQHLRLRNGSVTVAGLPSGEYRVRTHAPGLGGKQTFAISGDQTADIEIIGPFDIATAFAALALIGCGLVLAGRRMRQRTDQSGSPRASTNEESLSAPAPTVPMMGPDRR
jgi:hypothetical protein